MSKYRTKPESKQTKPESGEIKGETDLTPNQLNNLSIWSYYLLFSLWNCVWFLFIFFKIKIKFHTNIVEINNIIR